MDEPVITAQQLQERTVPDSVSVAAMVAMAMRMRLGWKPKRRYAIPIDAGVTADQPLRDRRSAPGHERVCDLPLVVAATATARPAWAPPWVRCSASRSSSWSVTGSRQWGIP